MWLFLSLSLLIILFICFIVIASCKNMIHPYSPRTSFDDFERVFGKGYWLTVVLSVFNRGNRLITTIDSIINSSVWDHTELLIVDDCSTDSSPKIEEEYAKAYPNNIRIIRHEKNSKVFLTRKHGVENASGRYLCFMDADDVVDEFFFEELLHHCFMAEIARKQLDVVQANNIRICFPKSSLEECSDNILGYADGVSVDELYRGNFFDKNISAFAVYLWTKIYRTSFLKDVFKRLPDTTINLGDDVIISYMIMFHMRSFKIINNTYAYDYFIIPNSLSSGGNIATKFFSMFAAVKKYFKDLPERRYLNKWIKTLVIKQPIVYSRMLLFNRP